MTGGPFKSQTPIAGQALLGINTAEEEGAELSLAALLLASVDRRANSQDEALRR
jgi:hypothetical protein